MGSISKEDFLKTLEQIETSTTNTPDLTPISGQIFFGTDFANILNLQQNDQANGSIHTPNTPRSPNLQTTQSSNGGKFYLTKLLKKVLKSAINFNNFNKKIFI